MMHIFNALSSKLSNKEVVRILFLGQEGSGKTVASLDDHSALFEQKQTQRKKRFTDHQTNEGIRTRRTVVSWNGFQTVGLKWR